MKNLADVSSGITNKIELSQHLLYSWLFFTAWMKMKLWSVLKLRGGGGEMHIYISISIYIYISSIFFGEGVCTCEILFLLGSYHRCVENIHFCIGIEFGNGLASLNYGVLHLCCWDFYGLWERDHLHAMQGLKFSYLMDILKLELLAWT